MRQLSRSFPLPNVRRVLFVGGVAIGVLAGSGFTAAALGSTRPTSRPLSAGATKTTPTTMVAKLAVKAIATSRVETSGKATPPATTPPATAPAPVRTTVARKAVVRPAARVFATGNAELDALLATLPAVLFEANPSVHFGYNPVDCCHAGGYNPEPNEVWVSERAFSSHARLVYVTVHELAHSVHLRTTRGPALTAAVAGAPEVRPGSPWDVSEKVADCVAWVLNPVETAASGITYWNCPDPWRSQVRAALQ